MAQPETPKALVLKYPERMTKPDLTCDNQNCKIHDKMDKLAGTLVSPPHDESEELIRTYFRSYAELLNQDAQNDLYDPKIVLAALFDLVSSAHYAQRSVQDGDWTYCQGQWDEDASLYFPYFNTCPRCSVKHDIKPKVPSNKPESSVIGDVAEMTTVLIIEKITDVISPNVNIYNSTDRQGDVDIVIKDDEVIAFGELKSSPLSVFPLEVEWGEATGEARGKEPAENHMQVDPDVSGDNINMFLPHKDIRIPLGPVENKEWPFPLLSKYCSDPAKVTELLEAWEELYDVYVNRKGYYGDHDPRRWLTCGCGGSPDDAGGSIDDTKNAPGLDRTDDIKKGTYQSLKYTTSYKDKCSGNHIRSVLVSNFLPARKYDRYLEDLHDLVLVKPGDDADQSVPDGFTTFNNENVYNLFDSVLCLTGSIHNDKYMREITGLETFADELRQQHQ